MAATFKAKLDGRFLKQARGRIERFYFEVGVLENKAHKVAASQKKGLKNLAGGPARKIGRKKSGLTIAEVSERLRKETGINFYVKPWKSKANADILKFIHSFMRMITQGGKLKEKKRLENTLQAVVRNPITRGDYGSNSPVTQKIKGFNRLMIDTGQLFRAIKARVRIKSVS
jgi:hypothetical protein